MSLLASADNILAPLLSAAMSILLLGDVRAIRGWDASIECSKPRAVSGQEQVSFSDIVTAYVNE